VMFRELWLAEVKLVGRARWTGTRFRRWWGGGRPDLYLAAVGVGGPDRYLAAGGAGGDRISISLLFAWDDLPDIRSVIWSFWRHFVGLSDTRYVICT